MRIDHLAFRVANRKKTAQFLTKALGYRPCHRIPNGFRVDFPDKTYADCTVLVPPERKVSGMSWNYLVPIPPKINRSLLWIVVKSLTLIYCFFFTLLFEEPSKWFLLNHNIN